MWLFSKKNNTTVNPSTSLTPQQQQQVLQQNTDYIKGNLKYLEALEQTRNADISQIRTMKERLKGQLATLQPFYLSTATLDQPTPTPTSSSVSAPQPYSAPSNQLPMGNFNPNAECSSQYNSGACTQTLSAPNGSCKIVTQTDGNLVLYNTAGTPLWSSGTYGRGVAPYKLTLLTTGDLVLSDSTGATLWSSNTSGKGKAPYHAKMHDNCNFALYDSSPVPSNLWSTGTAGK